MIKSWFDNSDDIKVLDHPNKLEEDDLIQFNHCELPIISDKVFSVDKVCCFVHDDNCQLQFKIQMN